MREKAALQCILKSLSSMKNCKRVVSLRISANAELYTTLKCLSQQMSALELLLVRYFRILLVYPCTLYYEMLTRWMQDIVGWEWASCTMVWKSWWVWARSKYMLPTLFDRQTSSYCCIQLAPSQEDGTASMASPHHHSDWCTVLRLPPKRAKPIWILFI